jgi:hypothetical protein
VQIPATTAPAIKNTIASTSGWARPARDFAEWHEVDDWQGQVFIATEFSSVEADCQC